MGNRYPLEGPLPGTVIHREASLTSYYDAPDYEEADPEPDLSAGRAMFDAIKAIPGQDVTDQIIAHGLSLLSAAIARSPWNNTMEGEIAQDTLNGMHDAFKRTP